MVPSALAGEMRSLRPHVQLDAPLTAARAFSMMSACTGTIAFCLLMVPMCVSFGDSHQYLLILCGMCVFTGVTTLFDLVCTPCALCSFNHVLCSCSTSCKDRLTHITSSYSLLCYRLRYHLIFVRVHRPVQYKEPVLSQLLEVSYGL